MKIPKIDNETEWEYTLQGIHYNLNGGSSGMIENLDIYQRLLETIAKLPHEIIDFVTESVFFMDGSSQWLPLNTLRKYKGIVILDNNLHKSSTEEQEFTIAHEIAHAKLKHHLSSYPEEGQEKEADNLAKKWLSRE